MSEKNENSNLHWKVSGVTIATSTPIRNSHQANLSIHMSTSNSSIQDNSNISGDTSTSTKLFTTLSISNNPTSDSEEEKEVNVIKQIANTGKDWDYFKPQDSHSLYRLVLNETGSIKDVAYRSFKLWENHPKDGVAFMLQFFIDVAGYQHYNIMKVYKTELFNEKYLHKEFINNCPAAIVDYTYLLNTNSKWSKNFQEKIYDFIKEIVICADNERHNYEMLMELVGFIKIMARSKIRPIKHTAVIIALKFLVPLSKVHAKLNVKFGKLAKDVVLLNVQDMKNLQVTRDVLRKLLDVLFSIILNNYAIQEPQLKVMRCDCIIHLYKALHWSPEYFFKSNVLEMFTKLLIDSSRKVRLTSLEIFKEIVKSKTCYPYFKGRAPHIFNQIFTCTSEADYTIAIMAVDVLSDALALHRKDIPSTNLNKIFLMVYNKYYPLASAAGRFLYAFILGTKNDKIAVIKGITKFSKMPNVEHMLPLLVEALMDCTVELHSYDEILKLILIDEEMPFEDKTKLLQILCHTVAQTITGRAVLIREKHRDGKINKSGIEKVMLILPRTIDLFTMFLKETDCVKSLLEMMLSFSYQDAVTMKYRADIIEVLKVLSKHFLDTNTSEILDVISKLFLKICNDYCPLNATGLLMLQNIFKDCEEAYNNFLKNENMGKCDLIPFENLLLKLQHLFKYHKSSIQWKVSTIENLFLEITKKNEKLLSYNLICGLYYEKETFQTTLGQILLDKNNKTKNLKNLNKKMDEILDVWFNYLHADNRQLIRITAYECICDFSIMVADEIFKNKDDEQVKSLRKKNLPKNNHSLLLKFMDEFIFNVSASESTGLKYFHILRKTIMERGLPFSLLPNILIHYNSFYNKYGESFNELLNNISKIDANVIGITISSTLFLEFQNIKTNRQPKTGKVLYIKKLALQFVKALSTQVLVSTVRFGINYAFAEKENLLFLHYLDSICNNLPLNSKSFLLDYVLTKTNYNKYQEEIYVTEFVKLLGSNKRKRNITEKVRLREAVSSTSTSNSQVSYPSSDEITETED